MPDERDVTSPDGTPMTDLGGESACYAHLVCPECGHLREGDPGPTCDNCGAARAD